MVRETLNISPGSANGHNSQMEAINGAASAPDQRSPISHDGEISSATARRTSNGLATQTKPSDDPAEQTWTIQPPTAPRSMRRKVSPPPIRRSDSYRPSERPSDRRFQHDVYRPSRRRFSNEPAYESRASASDCYRPPSPRHSQSSLYEGRVRMDEDDDEEELHRARRESFTNPYSKQNKHDVRPHQGSDQSWSPSTLDNVIRRASGQGFGSPLNGLSSREAQPRSDTNTEAVRRRGSYDGIRSGTVVEDTRNLDGRNGNATAHWERRASPVLARSPVKAGVTLDIPSLHQPRASSPPGTPPQFSRTSPDTPDYSPPEDGGAIDLDSAEEALTGPGSGIYLKTHREMLSQWQARLSNEETASTSSTTTSKSKTSCGACGVSGSALTPLIPCSKCRKGYHDRCGNPKPLQR